MVNDRYFNYLYALVETNNNRHFKMLLEQLYCMEFYSLVPNDDNRGVDGEQFRTLFIDKEGPSRSLFVPEGPCRVLEMLIGLAYRLEFEMLGGRFERPASAWFWVLIDNLGLKWCDNEAYLKDITVDQVDVIVLNMLERRYNEDGNGGLFPLIDPQKDQRRVEIWYQMSAWVIENYPI